MDPKCIGHQYLFPIKLIHMPNTFVHISFGLHLMTHSQLFEGFENESKWKTVERGGVEARSLAHNTLKR
jgi:hypothetical protein